jgi:hypothetical protein
MEPTLLDYVNLIWGIQYYFFAPENTHKRRNSRAFFVFLFGGAQMKRIHCKEKGKQQLSQQQVG